MGAAEGAGLALGALAGGCLTSSQAGISGGAYDANLLAQIALLGALAILTLATKGARARPTGRRPTMSSLVAESWRFLRGSKALRLLLVGALSWGLLFNAIEVFWQPRLREIVGEGGAAIFGIVNSGYFLASIIGTLALGALWKKGPRASLALVALLRLALCLSVAALSLQSSVGGFAAFFLLLMAFNGGMNVPEAAALNSLLPGDKRASFLSLVSLSTQVGGIVASLAFGIAKRTMDISSIWLLAAALFLGSAPLYLRAARSAEIHH